MKIIQVCLTFFIMYTLLQQLLPSGPFRKYMKFMGGMIFLLLFFQNLFQLENELPRLYKHYYRRAEAGIRDERGKEMLYEEYREQLEIQVRELLEQDGYTVKKVSVTLEEQQIVSLSVRLEHANLYDEIRVKKSLMEVYSLEESHINIKS